MGWSYDYSHRSAADVRRYLIDSLGRSGFTILDSASTKYGRNFWALLRKGDAPSFIFHAMINGARSDDYERGAWGYKDMTEESGPVEVDCPLRLVNAADPPEDGTFAAGWRDRVRAYHASRSAATAAVKAAGSGTKVWLRGSARNPYTVSYRLKNTLVGYGADGAGPFRLPTHRIERTEATS